MHVELLGSGIPHADLELHSFLSFYVLEALQNSRQYMVQNMKVRFQLLYMMHVYVRTCTSSHSQVTVVDNFFTGRKKNIDPW